MTDTATDSSATVPPATASSVFSTARAAEVLEAPGEFSAALSNSDEDEDMLPVEAGAAIAAGASPDLAPNHPAPVLRTSVDVLPDGFVRVQFAYAPRRTSDVMASIAASAVASGQFVDAVSVEAEDADTDMLDLAETVTIEETGDVDVDADGQRLCATHCPECAEADIRRLTRSPLRLHEQTRC